MKSMLAAARTYNGIGDLLKKYQMGKIRKKRESKLSKTISSLYEKLDELKVDIIVAINVKIDPALGLHVLRNNAEQKENLLKGVAIKCQILKSFIDENSIKNSLNRRITQMDSIEERKFQRPDKTRMICFNNTNLSWHEAFSNLTCDMNSYDMDLYNIGMLIKDSAVVAVNLLLSEVKSSPKNFLKSLLITYPLMLLKNESGDKFIINLHQTSNDGEEISDLLGEEKKQDNNEDGLHSVAIACDEANSTPTLKFSSKPGRKHIEERFPEIPEVATEFIKRNGYKAQEKRRNDDFVSCGVSVKEVREHLLKTIPGLAEYGLCENTVRYLFKPVNRNSSNLYKGVVECRVPGKDNSGRDTNEHCHFLHSRVNMRMEQAFLLEDEHIVFSADAMNKILVGDVLCVSRYHQIRRLFMVDDKPKTKDHDFPMGYKIIPCGKMHLLKRGVYLHDIFGDDMGCDNQSIETHIYEYDNVEVDTGYDTDGCVSSDDLKEEDANSPAEPEELGNDSTQSAAPAQNNITPSFLNSKTSSVESKKDKLGRRHIKFPRTGPVLVYNRNAQFHSQTMEVHANDFLPLFSNVVKKGRSCIVCVVDNGPDMNPTNYVNEFNLGKLWEDSGADMIIVTSYAAGQSAYNMIEHAWSPLSNRLTSVKLPAISEGEDKPPNKQTHLTIEQRAEKERTMLDNAADMLGQYWNCCSFDGHAVVPITVKSSDSKIYDEQDEILHFLGAPLRDFKTDKTLQSLRKRFLFYAKHAVRRENEFVLMKCQFFKVAGLECSYCQENPPKAKETPKLLKKFKGNLLHPIPSKTHPGHFHTFLEMVSLPELPEEQIGELGKCIICPNWAFTSITEQDKHRKLFHPTSKVVEVVPSGSQIHKCNFKINDKVCGEVFKSHHLLWKHKSVLGHTRKRNEVAKEQNDKQKIQEKNQQKEKRVAEKIVRLTERQNNGFSSDEDLLSEGKGDSSECESAGDEDEAENEVEVDNDDCNARPCIIDKIVKKKRSENVAWVRCSLCPRWFHQYCIGVDDDDLTFKCPKH